MYWLYQKKEFNTVPEKAIGFVYKITRVEDGKFYVGKKLFRSPKYITKNKKRKKIIVESDWRDYWGSSKELQEDHVSLGGQAFKREILEICYSKGTMSYIEAKFQLEFDVLRRDDCYNAFVGCRIHKKHLKGKICDASKNVV